jgi:UDP-N-acetylmuramoyl-tripeptide--D-alanyl-D-alanine ligase
MTFDLAAIIQGTGCRVLHAAPGGGIIENELRVADLQQLFYSVVIDSRRVQPGSLFVALPGEHTDGHVFLADAYTRGARGAMVKESTRPPELGTFLEQDRNRYAILVPDPLAALQSLARSWRDRQSAEVVAITGSIGKTTTKELVAAVLAARGPVLKSVANLNTEIGLPLTLLALSREHRAAVLEMGMYAKGDIELLASIACPRIGIVTNVEPIHLERLGSIERIAAAKSELVVSLPAEGLAILNGDNPWTRAMARTSGIARSVLVGLSSDCDYRAEDVRSHGLEGISFRLHAPGVDYRIQARIPGAHIVHAFLAASAAARELGMDWDEIVPTLKTVQTLPRQRLVRAPGNLVIIDDSYNAAPLSMRVALDLLGDFGGEKLAVLGDMLELGPGEEEAHRQVGVWVAAAVDWLVVRGPRAAWIAESARDHGLAPNRVISADTNAEAAEAVRTIVSSGVAASTLPMRPTIPPEYSARASSESAPSVPADPRWAVLVKGSRGMRMEEIVEALRGTT